MTERREQIDAFGATLLIGLSALLGLNTALVKIVNVGLAPIFQGGLRSAFAVVVIAGWMLMRRQDIGFRRGTRLLGLCNGTLFALEFALLFNALDYSSVARVSVLFYAMPVYVAIGAHFLIRGERLSMARGMGLVLAIAGVAMVMAERDGTSGSATVIGDLLAIGASICWAALTLLTRLSRLSELSAAENLRYHLIVSAIVLVAVAMLHSDTVRDPTPLIWTVFAFQVVFIASLGFLMWLWILSVYPVSNMASFSLFTPLFGVFFGWVIFDEQLTPTFIVALVCVCAGLLLINRKPRGAG